MSPEDLDRVVDAGYPRPQMVRSEWVPLDGEWGFAFDDRGVGREERWWDGRSDPFDRRIVVPYPPESELSGVGERGFHPVVWYRRAAPVPVREVGERLLLHFGAVDYRATVWVNGVLVGSHEGGHTSFELDASDAVPPAAAPRPAATTVSGGATPPDRSTAIIVVRAEDDPEDVHQPRGKQDWRATPHRIWYHRTTGIWQPVWWEVVPRCHIQELTWEVSTDTATVLATVALSIPPPRGSRLRLRLWHGSELLADHSQVARGRHHSLRVSVPAAENAWDVERLEWSPASPTLLGAQVELAHAGNERGDGAEASTALLDSVDSYLGWRRVAATEGRFLLNGRPQFLRMALAQGYWRESHLAAPSGADLRREVELAIRLGFNGVRVHQKVEDPRFLYWADRLGLMVWEEMPSAGAFSERAARRLLAEWQEVVRRDRSHPCITAWVPLNESWGVPALADQPAQRHLAASLYHLTHALDPTRPVISNDGWEHVDSDIWTVHDYTPSGASIRERYGDRRAVTTTLAERWPGPRRLVLAGAPERGQPVMLTEFGGFTYSPAGDHAWLAYGTVQSADEFANRLAELFGAVADSEALAGFCYTQLTDTEQEQNGLLFADRRPKLPFEQVKALVNRPSRAIPAEEVAAARRPPSHPWDGASPRPDADSPSAGSSSGRLPG